MVERVQVVVVTFLAPEVFESAVCDDLVGIHVGACSGTALNRIDNELVVELASCNFATGADDCILEFGFELTHRVVGLGRRLFHQREGANQASIVSDWDARDWEILHRPSGVDAPVGVLGNLEIAEEVMF